MNRKVILSAGAAAVVIAGGVVAAGGASAATHSHTVHLNATVLKTTETSKSTSVETDTLSSGGKTVGYETQSCNFGGTGDRCSVTFALKNGALLGHTKSPITTTSNVKYKGKITGGLGTYTGANGSIKVAVTGIHAKVTITYTS